MAVIQAKRKDGSPVQAGDRVFMVLENGTKHCGRVRQLYKPMKFHTMNYVMLQTYKVTCDDGLERPVHAWAIKKVFDNTPRRAAVA